MTATPDGSSVSLALALAFIGESVHVVVDRPLGSHHPVHGFRYEVNYGYVPGTRAPDGEELDAYVLGVGEPLGEFSGVCVAVVHRHDDDDDKLVVIPRGGVGPGDDEILTAVAFQERAGAYDVRRG